MQSPKETLFNNPEYLKIYQDLHKLTLLSKTAQPFIPLIPNDWGEAEKSKIIWYGGATNGWDEGIPSQNFDFKEANRANEKWLREKNEDKDGFRNKNPRPFWRVQRDCLDTIGSNWHQVIWNNVFRVGGLEEEARGVPPKALQKSQANLCTQAFEIELETLKPRLVVLHVGNLADEILHLIAGTWNDWEIYKVGNKKVCGYKTFNGFDFIWFSRAYSLKTLDVKNGFQWCLNGLASMK